MIWYILIILTFSLFTGVVAIALPRVLLDVQYTMSGSSDVGVKKIRERNGCAVVYKPHGVTGKYIEQYVLSERSGKKVLLCKLSHKICFMSYDVVVFDALNNMLEVKHIEELIENRGYTKELELPAAASYISILLKVVNSKDINMTAGSSIPIKNAVLFALGCFVISFVEILFVRFCIVKLLAGIFYESFVSSVTNTIISCVVAGIVCFVNGVAIVLVLKLKGRKDKQ